MYYSKKNPMHLDTISPMQPSRWGVGPTCPSALGRSSTEGSVQQRGRRGKSQTRVRSLSPDSLPGHQAVRNRSLISSSAENEGKSARLQPKKPHHHCVSMRPFLSHQCPMETQELSLHFQPQSNDSTVRCWAGCRMYTQTWGPCPRWFGRVSFSP